jgi:hypothetical protein
MKKSGELSRVSRLRNLAKLTARRGRLGCRPRSGRRSLRRWPERVGKNRSSVLFLSAIKLGDMMRTDSSRAETGSPHWGGECRAPSSKHCSAQPLQLRSNSENFRGSLPKSIFAQEERYFQKASSQVAFMASRRASYVFTNCCQTDGVRFLHLRYPAISSECHLLAGIVFRPTQSATLPCAGFHATSLQTSFNLVDRI